MDSGQFCVRAFSPAFSSPAKKGLLQNLNFKALPYSNINLSERRFGAHIRGYATAPLNTSPSTDHCPLFYVPSSYFRIIVWFAGVSVDISADAVAFTALGPFDCPWAHV